MARDPAKAKLLASADPISDYSPTRAARKVFVHRRMREAFVRSMRRRMDQSEIENVLSDAALQREDQ